MPKQEEVIHATTTEYQYHPDDQDRSIFASIKLVISSIAAAMVGMTSAVGKVSLITESLADTGLVMADSNKLIVTLETKGKELKKLEELNIRFPDLDIVVK